MTDIRRLGQIILDRVAAEVPELEGRVQERATLGLAFPYCTLGPVYGVEGDVECIEADEWTVQLDIWGQIPRAPGDGGLNKLSMAELAGKVRRALKGWSDTDAVTMHPLSVQAPRIMDDPDGKTVHAVIMVEAMVEG